MYACVYIGTVVVSYYTLISSIIVYICEPPNEITSQSLLAVVSISADTAVDLKHDCQATCRATH